MDSKDPQLGEYPWCSREESCAMFCPECTKRNIIPEGYELCALCAGAGYYVAYSYSAQEIECCVRCSGFGLISWTQKVLNRNVR